VAADVACYYLNLIEGEERKDKYIPKREREREKRYVQ
jgi:hypothetical protein